jgi:GNAT superfamily N-acetyltransferase
VGDYAIDAATAADVPALVALDSFAAPDNERAADIARWVAAGECICARRDRHPVGYCVLTRHFFGQPLLELVMVAPSHRRQGVATALIRHAIARARPVLWTSTNQSNSPMQALLERLGFRRSGLIEGLDADDPELIYRIV